MANKVRKLTLVLLCLIHYLGPSSQLDTLVQGQELKDGDNLVSAHGKFKLGFFNLTRNNYYLGIWYNGKHAELENLVWVANRDTPIFDNSGNLTIDDYGNLKISHNGGPPIVLYSAQDASNTSAALLETGNLVLSELNSGRQLWQSFDYPTHTLLPGMKLGVSRKTGHTWSLRSWISSKIPAASSCTFGMDPKLTNQLVILWHDIIRWNNSQDNILTFNYNFSYVSNENEAYFYYHGEFEWGKLTLDDWGELYDDYNFTLANCGVKLPECRNSNDEFYPDYGSWDAIDGFEFNEGDNLTLLDCKFKCLNNCSCVAFASTIEDTQTGCEIWSTPAIFGPHSNVTRTIYFLRAFGNQPNGSEGVKNTWGNRRQSNKWITIFVAVVVILITLGCFLCFAKWIKHKAEADRKKKQKMLIQELGGGNVIPSTVHDKVKKQNNDGQASQELQIFRFESISASTNSTKKYLLNWEKRVNIIEGIAQGLVYLHKYSRLKVIHRNLKASNILLDEDMNPKISDFGMARIFGLKELEENTNMIMGSYYGVLLLEIVSGKKNNSSHYFDQPFDLVGYAWQLWNKGKCIELIDPTILDESCPPSKILRCIHVGLLCAQDQATDRPTMVDVVSMFSNETLQLSSPKQPTYLED
uniref:non-specific serine/threonine protein kinase n=1 Tax=Quercus lobata TaxID=97700 RepID=A0A7N2R4I6_QUELO